MLHTLHWPRPSSCTSDRTYASTVALWLLALALCGLACSADDGGLEASARLIPPGDSDFAALEMPEITGECAGDIDCEATCEHSCAPLPDGPFTCPIVPIPIPDRVADAECLCHESVCAWRTR